MTVFVGVGSSLSPRVGERVGLGGEGVREGDALAMGEPVGDGSAIEPSPPPQAVSSKAAAMPSGGTSLAQRPFVAAVLDVTKRPPVTRAEPAARLVVVVVAAGARNANPIRVRTIPRTTAMPATPKATTEVNSDACRNAESIATARFGSSRVELGVGLPARNSLGVMVDDVRLAVRRDRAVHVVASRTVGVVGNRDPLVREGRGDDHPGRDSGDRHDDADHDGGHCGDLPHDTVSVLASRTLRLATC